MQGACRKFGWLTCLLLSMTKIVLEEVAKKFKLVKGIISWYYCSWCLFHEAFRWSSGPILDLCVITPNLGLCFLKKIFQLEMVKNDTSLEGASKQNAPF